MFQCKSVSRSQGKNWAEKGAKRIKINKKHTLVRASVAARAINFNQFRSTHKSAKAARICSTAAAAFWITARGASEGAKKNGEERKSGGAARWRNAAVERR